MPADTTRHAPEFQRSAGHVRPGPAAATRDATLALRSAAPASAHDGGDRPRQPPARATGTRWADADAVTVAATRGPSVAELPALYRDQAEVLAPYARGAAAAWRAAADLLAAALAAADGERLSIGAAARAGGWSYEALRRRVARDPALNAGVAGAPLITRGALRALGPGRGSRAGGVRAAAPSAEAAGAGAAPASPPVSSAASGAGPGMGPARFGAITDAAVARRRAAGAA